MVVTAAELEVSLFDGIVCNPEVPDAVCGPGSCRGSALAAEQTRRLFWCVSCQRTRWAFPTAV